MRTSCTLAGWGFRRELACKGSRDRSSLSCGIMCTQETDQNRRRTACPLLYTCTSISSAQRQCLPNRLRCYTHMFPNLKAHTGLACKKYIRLWLSTLSNYRCRGHMWALQGRNPEHIPNTWLSPHRSLGNFYRHREDTAHARVCSLPPS